MTQIFRRTQAVATSSVAVLAVVLAGCGGSNSPGASPASNQDVSAGAANGDGSSAGSTTPGDADSESAPRPGGKPGGEKVILKVGDIPKDDNKAGLQAFNEDVAAFEKANPDIDVQPVNIGYDQKTWAAQLAGNTLPAVLAVPFTEIQSLASRKQVADITDAMRADGLQDKLNPNLLKLAQDSSGRTYGVAFQAYAVGLYYNRDLFTKAGLDPDKPPATWDEVRSAAKQIRDKTGAIGFDFPTSGNVGGWMLTAMSYGFGGSIENADGTEATLTDPNTVAALTLLHDMYTKDRTMGDTKIVDWDAWQKGFAAGNVGMHLGAADNYDLFVGQYAMDPKKIGLAGLPQTANGGGTLSGGAFAVLNKNLSAAEQQAALQWIRFHYLGEYLDKTRAVAAAKTRLANKQAVGLPLIPPTSEAEAQTARQWIADLVNIDTKNFAPFTNSPVNTKLVPEPPNKAQDVYGKLDTVVQKAFGDPNADPAGLLSQAQTEVSGLLRR